MQWKKRCLGAGAALLLVTAAQAQKLSPAHTASGDLVGTRTGGVRTFLGVPYAAPPVGNLRWKLPQPVQAGPAPLAANRAGASCMQKLSHSKPPWTEAFMVQNEVSEDCLYLNIWAPANTGTPHPVLVFLHGGGFVEGSGSIASYDGTALAERGVVVVNVNYRLGIFGYLAGSALQAESPQGSAGNYAMADQIAALQWVQRNIRALGGDPQRVTVAGQSAGAESVAELLASPAAKGLFQRAVMNSDPLLWPAMPVKPLAESVAAGDRWMAAHGGLAGARAMPAEALLQANDVPAEARRPTVDGVLLPVQPGMDLRSPTGSDVPVLAGWVADEGSASPTYGKLSAAEFRADAQKKYGPQADRFLALYPAGDDAEASRSQIASARDRNLATTLLWAEAWKAHRHSPVYLYELTRVPPWKAHPEFRTHHTADVPYFFSTLTSVHDRDYTDVDRAVSHTASESWVQFAATGKPGSAWTPVTGDHGPVFEMGDAASLHPVLEDAQVAFWRGVLLKE